MASSKASTVAEVAQKAVHVLVIDDQNVRAHHRTLIGKPAIQLDVRDINYVACGRTVPERDAADAGLLAYLAAYGIR